MSDKPLTVEIVDGVLSISIGIEILCFALEHGLQPTYGDVTITDCRKFSAEVLRELKDDEGDGTTLVHRMLDKAAANALESGAEGIEFPPIKSKDERVKELEEALLALDALRGPFARPSDEAIKAAWDKACAALAKKGAV